jgi:drug/metabolite transporter (DMT)-like permease
MDIYYGLSAALGAAFCWSICSVCFTAAGKQVGSLTVGFIRLAMAFILFCVYGLLVRGHCLPTDATAHTWTYLAISGVVGFFIGDVFLFRSFLLIGPRLSLLVMSTWPAMSVLLGWIFLSERLTGLQMSGMLLTLCGILVVVSERQRSRPGQEKARRVSIVGVLFAFLGAVGQSVGLLLSKIGMLPPGAVEQYDEFASNQIRAIAALVAYAVLFFVLHRWRKLGHGLKQPKPMAILSLGAVIGPFIGVVLSLVALRYVASGMAATLMATSPVLIIPFSIIILHEKVTRRAVLGAAIAVAGVVVLFAQAS